jgi:hypothetical protein
MPQLAWGLLSERSLAKSERDLRSLSVNQLVQSHVCLINTHLLQQYVELVQLHIASGCRLPLLPLRALCAAISATTTASTTAAAPCACRSLLSPQLGTAHLQRQVEAVAVEARLAAVRKVHGLCDAEVRRVVVHLFVPKQAIA